MTPDRAADLMAAFRSARVQAGESAEKIELLGRIEDLEGPDVDHFLAMVASDASEYDLARIEAIRVLERRRFEGNEERESVASVLRRVLAEDDDDQVRSYAARALGNFTQVPGVVATAGALVLDQDEDIDIRHNAFFALERSAPTEEAVDLVTRCLAEDEFQDAARRVLAKWHGLGT